MANKTSRSTKVRWIRISDPAPRAMGVDHGIGSVPVPRPPGLPTMRPNPAARPAMLIWELRARRATAVRPTLRRCGELGDPRLVLSLEQAGGGARGERGAEEK